MSLAFHLIYSVMNKYLFLTEPFFHEPCNIYALRKFKVIPDILQFNTYLPYLPVFLLLKLLNLLR